MISLSDSQLSCILDAAKGIDPAWRSRFLENVADQLLGIEVSNEAVAHAVMQVRRRMSLRTTKGQAA